ncbi:hypothetical protein HDV57DRAFT_41249 [Trichoderma longibrachiatum]
MTPQGGLILLATPFFFSFLFFLGCMGVLLTWAWGAAGYMGKSNYLEGENGGQWVYNLFVGTAWSSLPSTKQLFVSFYSVPSTHIN